MKGQGLNYYALRIEVYFSPHNYYNDRNLTYTNISKHSLQLSGRYHMIFVAEKHLHDVTMNNNLTELTA